MVHIGNLVASKPWIIREGQRWRTLGLSFSQQFYKDAHSANLCLNTCYEEGRERFCQTHYVPAYQGGNNSNVFQWRFSKISQQEGSGTSRRCEMLTNAGANSMSLILCLWTEFRLHGCFLWLPNNYFIRQQNRSPKIVIMCIGLTV